MPRVPLDLPSSLRVGECVPHVAQRAFDAGALLDVGADCHPLWGGRAVLGLGVSILPVPPVASHERRNGGVLGAAGRAGRVVDLTMALVVLVAVDMEALLVRMSPCKTPDGGC